MKYFIYRQEKTAPFEAEERDGTRFCFCATPVDVMRVPVVKRMGIAGALKMLAKLATPSRDYYCLVSGGRIINDGFISHSFCRYYEVDPGSAVIGPVWTYPELRGKGLAVFGMKSAINALIQRGFRIFYVDTSEQNLSMQGVIAKCGFGNPVGSFERPETYD